MSASPGGVGVWAEDTSLAQLTRALPALASARARLGLSVPEASLGDPKWAAFTRAAADRGVVVRAWPLLAKEHGYWLGTHHAEAARSAVAALLRWRSAVGGPVFDGVSFDLEPDYARVAAARQVLFNDPAEPRRGRRSWTAARRALTRTGRGIRWSFQNDVLARAVDDVAQAGLVAHAVTLPIVLDQAPGSEAFERFLELASLKLGWSEISVMVYQTVFAEISRQWLGPALVFEYARAARERWGERAGLDLGVVGGPGVALGPEFRYPDPRALARDWAAARAAGIPDRRLRVYGLQGLLEQGGVERWIAPEVLRAAHPEPERDAAPPRSSRVAVLRKTCRAASAALSPWVGR
jgi:hypothetical protein